MVILPLFCAWKKDYLTKVCSTEGSTATFPSDSLRLFCSRSDKNRFKSLSACEKSVFRRCCLWHFSNWHSAAAASGLLGPAEPLLSISDSIILRLYFWGALHRGRGSHENCCKTFLSSILAKRQLKALLWHFGGLLFCYAVEQMPMSVFFFFLANFCCLLCKECQILPGNARNEKASVAQKTIW